MLHVVCPPVVGMPERAGGVAISSHFLIRLTRRKGRFVTRCGHRARKRIVIFRTRSARHANDKVRTENAGRADADVCRLVSPASANSEERTRNGPSSLTQAGTVRQGRAFLGCDGRTE